MRCKTEKNQIVQIRSDGYSFNRLAPYDSLDEYLPEIRRTWDLYRELALPVQVRAVRLRYINRILLPGPNGDPTLSRFLKVAPQLQPSAGTTLEAFLNHRVAVDLATGYRINTSLSSQFRLESMAPVILDNGVEANLITSPDDWTSIADAIGGLRKLKNRVFQETLTDECLNLFR
jgi:uncharacterized protein (TIGR04255 family)